MFVHDISDIFIDALKMVNLLKLEGRRGWFASEISYVATLVSWVYFRLYEYPFRVMYSSNVLAYKVTSAEHRTVANSGFMGLIPPDLSLLLYNNILLAILLCLHIYWFYLLVRIGLRIVSESVTQASRMEYEGDSDVEDESTNAQLQPPAKDIGGGKVVGMKQKK